MKFFLSNISTACKPHENLNSCTAYKVPVFGVFLVRIQSACGKIHTRKTPNTDTFCAVLLTMKI